MPASGKAFPSIGSPTTAADITWQVTLTADLNLDEYEGCPINEDHKTVTAAQAMLSEAFVTTYDGKVGIQFTSRNAIRCFYENGHEVQSHAKLLFFEDAPKAGGLQGYLLGGTVGA